MGQYKSKYDDLLKQVEGQKGQMGTDPRGLTTISGGVNRYGQVRPDYTTIGTAEGTLDPRFQETMGESYGALREKAMAEGDTAATGIMRQQLGAEGAAMRDRMQRDMAGSTAQARSNMAMKGGLRGGAAERLGQAGMRQQMGGLQDLGRQQMMGGMQLSLADEQTKNQLLGQLGGVEQQMGAANIGRLQQDIQGQNIFQSGMYSEDMKAYSAQKSADAQASAARSSCFLAGTSVDTEVGVKKIEDVRLGDMCKEGGETIFLSQAKSDHFYEWKGIRVTGTHAIKYEGKWMRVQDLPYAEKIMEPCTVYCIGNINHILMIKGEVFSDYYETDLYDTLNLEESITYLNGEL